MTHPDDSTPRYMDGIGIRRKTGDLTDEMFSRFPLGLAGALATASAPMGIALNGLSFSTVAGGLVLMAVGAAALAHFLPAIFRLQEHTDALNREVRLRGKGWAKS